MSSSAIELRGVSRTFGKGAPALAALDLAIREGERLAVLGPSGSGKTTLLRLIAGLEVPDAGDLCMGGRAMRGVPAHQRKVAMVFQNPALYPHLDVANNLAFGLRATGVRRPERLRRVREIAEVLGLLPLLSRRPDELSGGERQRVALGRAMARRPSILLLDEPFSNLDEPLRAALRSELMALHRQFPCTLIHVTHDQREALGLGDRVAVLCEGRLIQIDSPLRVFEQPAHLFVATFVGDPGMNTLAVDVLLRDGTFRISTPGGTHPIDCLAQGPFAEELLLVNKPRGLILGIRPAAIRVAMEAHADPSDADAPFLSLSGVVRRNEFRGLSRLITIDAEGWTIVTEASGARKFSEGQRVFAQMPLRRALWFDAVTGRRLELHCQPLANAIG